ncbi:MAG: TonB-dependent receptor [Bacteroidales bacterium]|jgi:TonB-linked SusC/RagA family outer membrane protein|nr:TonB-dependent receptor [Bacteroidales bacterium]
MNTKLLLLFLLSLSSSYIFAQKQITGTVTNEDNEAIPGVAVTVQGSSPSVYTVTDLNGHFSITVPQGYGNLTFSAMGKKGQTISVGSKTSIEISLISDAQSLDAVVVVGYGTQRKGDLTGAISTVTNDDIDQRPVISAGQAIQGKAAGVYVQQPNGAPGADLTIRVRGTVSFNGSNDPLYVVDGVPVDNINFLAPNDIADIQILKDASSAAIYGSRAANGIVIVTTKAGRAGKTGNTKVTLSAQVGISQVANQIKSLNAKQYKELMDEISPGSVPDGTTDIVNWFDEVYSTGITQNYNLSVSGGNDKWNYYLSGGYLDEKGTVTSAFFKRYSARAAVDGNINKWFSLGANISYSDNTRNGITTGMGSNRGGVVLSVINLPSSVPIIDPATGLYNRMFYGQNINNPLESIENGKYNKENESRLIASANALITFLPGFTFRSTFSLDRRNGLSTGYTPVNLAYSQYGDGYDFRNTNQLLVWDNVLNYEKSIKKHNFNIMGGTSWTESHYTNSWMRGSHYRNDDIQTLNAANRIAWGEDPNATTGTGASQWAIMSVFGRAFYNYDDRYLITANVRTDGSSKLHPDHRWGVFPSVSGAWRISNEEFLKEVEWIDNLKIRAGWGQTGNQSGIGDYSYLQRYNITRLPWFDEGQSNAVPVISQGNLRTSDLRWETTGQTNIGIDFAVLKNRLSFEIDYYYKRTKDMLMYVSLPDGAAAASDIVRNEGVMQNQGIEFTVNSKNFVDEFKWNTNFNISFNRNKLVSLELQKIYYDGETTDAFHEVKVVRNEPGHAMGSFWGYESLGVDPETGDLIYRDLNDDKRITSNDKTYIGDPNPDFTFGMTNTFEWKGFTLIIFLQGSYGNDIFNASKGDLEGMYDLKNQSTRVLERWRVPGQITDVPRAKFNIQPSTWFIEDGSYLRVKDITLSYNFANSLLKKAGITRLSPYFTAQNLLTFTKYSGMDPEVNQWGNSGAVQGIDWGTYPHSRTYVFGINIEF